MPMKTRWACSPFQLSFVQKLLNCPVHRLSIQVNEVMSLSVTGVV
jgi:hypothetical protein